MQYIMYVKTQPFQAMGIAKLEKSGICLFPGELKQKSHPKRMALMWCWVDSNHRLTDFQSDALPTELQHPEKVDAKLDKYWLAPNNL